MLLAVLNVCMVGSRSIAGGGEGDEAGDRWRPALHFVDARLSIVQSPESRHRLSRKAGVRMGSQNDEDQVGDYPTENERFWFSAAITAFIFTVIAFGIAGVWTFSLEGQNAVFRAQTFAPYGIALGATVTFFTVIWRGVIASKQLKLQADQIKLQGDQLNQQIDQLAQVIRQNDAKEDESLLRLLQDGAKFITESDKAAQIMAGIASLDVLLSNDVKRKYSVQAMDILAEYYLQNYSLDTNGVASARRVLNRGADANIRSTISAKFVGSTQKRKRWPRVLGFASQRYVGGTFQGRRDLSRVQSEARNFHEVEFNHCSIRHGTYKDCHFVKCKIVQFDVDELAKNIFTRCDFSDCDFTNGTFSEIGELSLLVGDNYY